MRCPKCQFDHALQTTECLKCGIVFSRYQAAREQAAKEAEAAAAERVAGETNSTATHSVYGDTGMKTTSSGAKAQFLPDLNVGAKAPTPDYPLDDTAPSRSEDVRELICRAVALPLALLLAYLVTGTGLRMVAAMLSMVLHESGHAITAWLTGRWAVPLPWVTPHGQARSLGIILMVTAAILFAGFLAWKAGRWGWVCAAAGGLLLQFTVLSLPAEQMIVFFGDGGAMVLATILMATFYAPRGSALVRSWGLRWGLLAIGALSFMHVYRLWTGPFEDIPFGEIEGVNMSDPSLLTEMYGWTVPQLIERYVRLGRVCLGAMVVLYVGGLIAAYMGMARSSSGGKARAFGIGGFGYQKSDISYQREDTR